MWNKQTFKELGIILGVCIAIAIIDRVLIYFGHSVSEIFFR